MINYTTPAIPLIVENKDLSSGYDVWVSLEQNKKKLEKKNSDLIITAETHGQQTDTNIILTLTQEESGSFDFGKSCSVMVNWIDASGVRGATEMKTIPVMRNLLDRVIQYGD